MSADWDLVKSLIDAAQHFRICPHAGKRIEELQCFRCAVSIAVLEAAAAQWKASSPPVSESQP